MPGEALTTRMRVRAPALAGDVASASSISSSSSATQREVGCRARAFEAAYRDYAPLIWRTLARLGVPADDLDDALQDVFTVVHRKLPEFEGRSTLRTWIYAIAIRVARKRRSRRQMHAPLEAEPCADTKSPFDQLVVLEGMELFDAIVSQMDEAKRHIFVLREVEQLSAPEISKITGVKLFTVYSRLRVAKRFFECALARRGLGRGGTES